MRTLAWILLFCWGARLHGNQQTNWPSFRGSGARGVAEGFVTPSSWDVASGTNVLWKTPIPGLGHSAPVIWGNKIFVTTAVSEAGEASLKVGLYGDIGAANDRGPQKWKVLCLDKETGRLGWERTAQ